VSFSVRKGELVALIGPNGAGKTTTLKAVFGLIPVEGGDVRLDGSSLLGRPPYERIRHGLSLMPEGRRIFPAMTVEENLELGGFAVPPPGWEASPAPCWAGCSSASLRWRPPIPSVP